MMRMSTRFTWCLWPAVLTLTACVSTAKMALPESAAPAVEYTVRGANPFAWDKPLQFGRWHTTQLKDKGRLDAGLSFGKLGIGGTYHGKTISTNTGSAARCSGLLLSASKDTLAVDPAFGNLPVLSCTFSGTQQGELSLRQDHLNRLQGQLVSGNQVYDISSVHQLAGGLFSSAVPVGFHVKKQQQLYWSVEKINEGRVLLWQQGDAAEQDLLATASLVLLATNFDNLLWEEPVP
ncbi:hypothetical protein [Rheinheimera sp.]|uniref:hypothetical protein n=1 Tax=Rheinheimera sp. TaxID=1869214 RepID=UPI002601162A|nr:hypothetical protein [Rheinheimera sp.]